MFSIGFWVGQVLPRFPIWLASIDGVCDVLCCAGVAIVGISTSAPLIMLLRPGILPLLLAGSHPCISPLRNFSHGCQCHLVVLNLWEIAPKLCLFGAPPLSPPIRTSSSLSPASTHLLAVLLPSWASRPLPNTTWSSWTTDDDMGNEVCGLISIPYWAPRLDLSFSPSPSCNSSQLKSNCPNPLVHPRIKLSHVNI